MAIKKGDRLVVNVSGSDVIATAASDQAGDTVQIKYKKTISTVNISSIKESQLWVLACKGGKHLETGGEIYVAPKEQLTGVLKEAKTFPSEAAAQEYQVNRGTLIDFVPKRIK